MTFAEVVDGVFVRRHESLDLNCGLVVGDGACLVVDTRSHPGEAADLVAAVRRVTPHPWTVVDTHAHYDHCFGNAAFRPATIWGSRGCAADLLATGEAQRAARVAELLAEGDAEGAEQVRRAPLDPPDALVDDVAVLDVGGVEVVLRFLGRGHTGHDLVVEVEDGVVFAGDLVEEGAPPAFDDAFPVEWPATLGRLHAMARGPVVPGHGAVVDAAFVGAQREELLAVLAALRAGRLDRGPYPEATMRTAASRLG
ncbi:glyoxylase-like metal-dependent hydrolase (beta-lactamase superfamily II) [Geodermatophilus normandii]|uniref:Glyoxylase-like metal-dependent hydrolase (Beta-lactamase superfamily II) n=1 Tax=Geodermatophilus normandii TaxID=1137989 RepID=A0A317QQ43_9ACTN|nr:MBL fold metallo-hydrolase [Geodermatophilus normandii]PWW25219.1 glyoxylase-like metal-dependent hydrolase (beta-lactamase superfamily II) [Geodermatophilus normandii]